MYSIVIPTYNHFSDYLKPCLDSIGKFTTHEYEIIVVANGCTDETREQINTMDLPIVYHEVEEAVGFTIATNIGLAHAKGEYIILLNNDTILLPQRPNLWVEFLKSPFIADENCGVSGPVKFTWKLGSTNRTAIAFWCAMISKRTIDTIGVLDESFSPGMGEDGDFCIRAELAGFKLYEVPFDQSHEYGKGSNSPSGMRIGSFPIYHKGSGTFAEVSTWSEITKRNNEILLQRYGQ